MTAERALGRPAGLTERTRPSDGIRIRALNFICRAKGTVFNAIRDGLATPQPIAGFETAPLIETAAIEEAAFKFLGARNGAEIPQGLQLGIHPEQVASAVVIEDTGKIAGLVVDPGDNRIVTIVYSNQATDRFKYGC